VTEIAIAVEQVTFGYSKDEPIVQDATFKVKSGEFIGMIGPNGGGKTTLLKLLMGFIEPWKGEISIFGKSPHTYPNGLAYVPQQLRFDKQFPITVMELVLGGRLALLPWWGSFSKNDREIAFDALEKVQLTEFATKPFGTLSGGQAQRALIARALASEPRALLLDEPTANVDSQAEADIHELLVKIRNQLTIIMVTHDIRAIIHKVERVLCVQCQVDSISPTELCEHFALGLYHFPLIQTGKTHLTSSSFAKTPFRT